MFTRSSRFSWLALAACGLSVPVSVCAQTRANLPPPSAALSMRAPVAQTEAQCQRDIQKFDQVIEFIRQAQGKEPAARLREKMLPAQTESSLLSQGGPCGLAKHLREKRLVD